MDSASCHLLFLMSFLTDINLGLAICSCHPCLISSFPPGKLVPWTISWAWSPEMGDDHAHLGRTGASTIAVLGMDLPELLLAYFQLGLKRTLGREDRPG